MVNKTLLFALLIALAALCPAPIRLPIKNPHPMGPESTNEQLMAQQKSIKSAVVPEVGTVPKIENPAQGFKTAEVPLENKLAANNVSASSQRASTTQAVEAITGSSGRIERELRKPLLPPYGWAVVTGLFGFTVLFGIRRYVDRSTPVPVMSKKMMKRLSRK
jgi:hypothetical protein